MMTKTCNCLYGYGDPRCCVSQTRNENMRRAIDYDWSPIVIDHGVPEGQIWLVQIGADGGNQIVGKIIDIAPPWEDREGDCQPERKP